MKAPRGLRTRLTLLVGAGATILVTVLTVGFNVVLRSSLAEDADQVARERAESALETVVLGRDGQLRLLEAPPAQDSGTGVWVFGAQGQALERPPADPAVQQLAASLAGGNDAFADEADADVRLYSRAIRADDGNQVGTVVAALSVEPYEHTVKRALIASIAFAILMLGATIIGTWLLLGRALHTVSRMTTEATEWSEHDLDHRFAAGEPYDEITELAAAFDSMLDKLASSLRHEQRLSAEISHELRTPLAAILAESELSLAHGASKGDERAVLERIADRATALTRILDALLAAARGETRGVPVLTPVRPILERALADGRTAPGGADLTFRLADPDGEGDGGAADVEPELVERIVAPLIENACRFAQGHVELSVATAGSTVVIGVADDGPGVRPGDEDAIFEPGWRGDADGPGAGLGLALSRRLARAVGGDVVLVVPPPQLGALFEVRLPSVGSPRDRA
jgi:signal transduction histidine kinase